MRRALRCLSTPSAASLPACSGSLPAVLLHVSGLGLSPKPQEAIWPRRSARSARELTAPQKRLESSDSSWCLNTPAPSLLRWAPAEACASVHFRSSPQGTELQWLTRLAGWVRRLLSATFSSRKLARRPLLYQDFPHLPERPPVLEPLTVGCSSGEPKP